ncbi:hypothetical protein DPMN_132723 [Dreissena polymorpha]|uniref:Uncharacterized protein n=1 Tax=Dreissena polymorpha TaxID=45954 RepID=A0A9D4JDC8_DREPO|nr:hypothetical protein DPMN_132723 [Dreissena polymorpha]
MYNTSWLGQTKYRHPAPPTGQDLFFHCRLCHIPPYLSHTPAGHRERKLLWGKTDSEAGQTRPVLIKFRNNHDKSIVMRKPKEMKQAGYRLVYDVTNINTGLMSRLQLHKEIESTWFFNGSVFAQTKRNERIRFDLYDNIDLTIQEHRAKRK